MLIVIAYIQIRPGDQHRENVLNAFRKITPVVLQEPGCHGYELLMDHELDVDYQTKIPDSITMLEQWQSLEHLMHIYRLYICKPISNRLKMTC